MRKSSRETKERSNIKKMVSKKNMNDIPEACGNLKAGADREETFLASQLRLLIVSGEI